jgi:hypothetical protein
MTTKKQELFDTISLYYSGGRLEALVDVGILMKNMIRGQHEGWMDVFEVLEDINSVERFYDLNVQKIAVQALYTTLKNY